MVDLTYAEEREVGESDIFRPPHLARMLEEAGRYVGRMDRTAREEMLENALAHFWHYRHTIRAARDLRRNWRWALNWAALQRPRWRIWTKFDDFEWVQGRLWRGEI